MTNRLETPFFEMKKVIQDYLWARQDRYNLNFLGAGGADQVD